ncbi:hypothetical protein JX265_001753 [Neoarthrinium moseri]|uniref:Aminoglycoside phosphotransferase domain-containing protein n=1 Tax=Neoarthrinium moseri TaxID=1658444 RepID=A0A9P9WVY3_9PEZI|nr:hypothetical protein JX265_001753 [Neoarthrinium moseri]
MPPSKSSKPTPYPLPPQNTPSDEPDAWTDPPPRAPSPPSVAPVIRILAPTPESEGLVPLGLRRRPRSRASTTTMTMQPASQPWTDELVKKTINTESAFDDDSSSSSASSRCPSPSPPSSDLDGEPEDYWPQTVGSLPSRSPGRSASTSSTPPDGTATGHCAVCNAGPAARGRQSSYRGHIKLLSTSRTAPQAVWALGGKSVLKEREGDRGQLAYEARNLAFARAAVSSGTVAVAVPEVLASWREGALDKNEEERSGDGGGGDAAFLLMSRVPGHTLAAAWAGLGPEERSGVARAVAGWLREMRKITSDAVAGVDGGPLMNTGAFFGWQHDEPVGPYVSDQAVWDTVARTLDAREVPPLEGIRYREETRLLKDRVPRMGPYVFTHGDLTASNIIVKDGKFGGLVDFAASGFYPVWWEWVHTHDVDDAVDMEWKMELRKYMDCGIPGLDFKKALEWYNYWGHLRSSRPFSNKTLESKRDLGELDRN